MLTSFPAGDDALIDEKAESEMQSVIELITKVRNIPAEMGIKAGDRLSIHVAANAEMQAILPQTNAQIKKLARADKIVLGDSLDVPKASAKAVLTGNAEIAVPLEGLIDFDKERERLQNQIDKLDIELQRLNGQLSNASFVEKAPERRYRNCGTGRRDRATDWDAQFEFGRIKLNEITFSVPSLILIAFGLLIVLLRTPPRQNDIAESAFLAIEAKGADILKGSSYRLTRTFEHFEVRGKPGRDLRNFPERGYPAG